jgi:hypothetical protein
VPTYTIRDPQTGRTLTVRGDSPPTEAEAAQLFAAPVERASDAPATPAHGSLVTPAVIASRAVLPAIAKAGQAVATSPLTGPAVKVGGMLAGAGGGQATGHALLGALVGERVAAPGIVEQAVRGTAGAVGRGAAAIAPVSPSAAEAASVAALQGGTKAPGVISRVLGGPWGLAIGALFEPGHPARPRTPAEQADWDRQIEAVNRELAKHGHQPGDKMTWSEWARSLIGQ